jgi:hypothetical protein
MLLLLGPAGEVLQYIKSAFPSCDRHRRMPKRRSLELITEALARHGEPIDPATLFDGDDRDWSWPA